MRMRTDALLVILVAVSQVAAEYRQAAAETPAGRAVEEYAGSSVSPEDVLKAAKAGWRRVRERYHYFSATVSWHLVLDNVLDGLVDSQTISREGVIKKYDDRVWLAVGQHQERKRTGKTATLARGACVNDRYVFAVEGQSLTWTVPACRTAPCDPGCRGRKASGKSDDPARIAA
ncbi:MAG: hypothetical protein KatS3mg110_1448 [Pirellulaceae bacterium]|nr:MAG: hypothetical protein KatS3mg110_1448 [Pirellulaceae bacterium]